jgi:predicted dehydrogenase
MKRRGAISGFGQVAELGHLPGWRSLAEVEIVALHEPQAARRQAALRAFDGKIRVYEDLELMLAGEALDFVDLASPPAAHVGAITQALMAGAHVLVEKPLCLPQQDEERLFDLANGAQRLLLCVHNWKYAPAYRQAFELIKAGRLGPIRHCAMLRLRTAPAGGAPWRLDSSEGGGILIDHGWHLAYLMPWLIGAPPAQVSARIDRLHGLDDGADLMVEFANQASAYVHLSWHAPIRHTRAIIYGDRGWLSIGEEGLELRPRRGATEFFAVADAPDDSYHASWFGAAAADFLAALEQGHRGVLAQENYREVRAVLAWLRATQAAATTGRMQPVGR